MVFLFAIDIVMFERMPALSAGFASILRPYYSLTHFTRHSHSSHL
jgi:hypothetical protein